MYEKKPIQIDQNKLLYVLSRIITIKRLVKIIMKSYIFKIKNIFIYNRYFC